MDSRSLPRFYLDKTHHLQKLFICSICNFASIRDAMVMRAWCISYFMLFTISSSTHRSLHAKLLGTAVQCNVVAKIYINLGVKSYISAL